jgi:hypothetical protein
VLEVGFFLSPWIGMLGAKWKGYFLQWRDTWWQFLEDVDVGDREENGTFIYADLKGGLKCLTCTALTRFAGMVWQLFSNQIWANSINFCIFLVRIMMKRVRLFRSQLEELTLVCNPAPFPDVVPPTLGSQHEIAENQECSIPSENVSYDGSDTLGIILRGLCLTSPTGTTSAMPPPRSASTACDASSVLGRARCIWLP